jgi:predicted GIY-YIG superfamily endonuclease
VNEQHLYRLYDSDDNLLYVGISKSAMNRIGQHLSTQPWAANINRMTIEHFTDRAAVQKAERLAIATENPIYNKHRFSATQVPIEELWTHMSTNERRMVGQVLLNVSYLMNDDEIDYFASLRDEHYINLMKILRTAGELFLNDEQPDVFIGSLFAATQQKRLSYIQDEYADMLNERKAWQRTKQELEDDITHLSGIVDLVRDDNRWIKEQFKKRLKAVAS